MRGVASFAAGALLGAALGSGSPAAWGDFQQSATSSASFSADVLQPPSGVSGTSSCRSEAVLTWTASPTPWLQHYDVLLATSAEGPYEVLPLNGQDPLATSRTVSGLTRNTTYYLTVRAVSGSWWSGVPPVTVRPQGRAC